MKNKIFTISAAVLFSLVAGPGVSAQRPYDFERVVNRNFWNDGTNAAGLRTDSLSISYARLYGEYTGGGLKHTYESDASWTAGLKAETIKHLDKFSMKGHFGFDNTNGRNMCGSMSARPGYFPVDILEFTPGKKTRQNYAIGGSISADLGTRWRIGGELEFLAANYVKSKDLRHTDYLLDLKAAPGVMYYTGDFAVGLSYTFRKSSESIKAEELGVSSEHYYAFLDKGMMFGTYDVWDISGLHLSESGMSNFPGKEMSHGAGLQFQWKNLYAELGYTYSSGNFGEKDVRWFEFPGHTCSVDLGWRISGLTYSHYIRLDLGYRLQTSYETVMDRVTEGGVTTPVIYSENPVYYRQKSGISPEYVLDSDRFGFSFRADLMAEDEMSSQMYPYLYTDRTLTADFMAGFRYSIKRFDIGLETGVRIGNVSRSERLADSGVSAGEYPYFMEEYYVLEKEYTESPKIDAGLSFRYNFFKGLYAEVSGMYGYGLRIAKLTDPHRWTAGLGIGYIF